MTRSWFLVIRCAFVAMVGSGVVGPGVARAQGGSGPQEPPEFRRATTTQVGDTGLWFLPTAEVILPQRVAATLSRTDVDFRPGSTDVAHFGVSANASLTRRIEIFGVWLADTRIDRDEQPLFNSGSTGGLVNDFPLVTTPWSEARGDTIVGAKIGFLSQADGRPVALAIRPFIKFPTGNADKGVSTGKIDGAIDLVVSRETTNARLEWTLTAGYIARGDPPGIALSDGLRWGAGIAFPSRRPIRAIVEAHGERYVDRVVRVRATDLTRPMSLVTVPLANQQTSPVNLNIGVDWLSRNKMFIGAAVQMNLNQPAVAFGSRVGFQGRIGFHPGVLLPRSSR